MRPKERVMAALELREPDRIPWGEHSIDYNVYQDILGRETLLQAKIKTTRALWEGRRDEVVAHTKRDALELARVLEFDIVTARRVPSVDYQPTPMKQIDEETYENANGDIYRISAATGDLRLFKKVAPIAYEPPTIAGLQEKIDAVDEEPMADPEDSVFEVVRHTVKEMGEALHEGRAIDDHDQWRQQRFGQRRVARAALVATVEDALALARSRQEGGT
jgi:hypothetical protein